MNETSKSKPRGSPALTVALLKGGLGSALIKIASAALAFMMFLFAGRALTVETFSAFGFGFSAATLLILIGSIGQRLLALKYVPIYAALDEKTSLLSFTQKGYGTVMIGCVVSGGLLMTGSIFFTDLGEPQLLLSISFFGLILGIAEYQSRLLRGHGTLYLALLPREVIWRSIVVAGFALVTLKYIPQPEATTVFIFLGASLGIVTLIQALLHPYTRPSFVFKSNKSTESTHNWSRTAVRFWGSSVLRGATPNCSVILVTLYLSVSESAAYFGAYRLALALNLLLVATNMLSMPLLSKAHQTGRTADTHKVTQFITLFTSVPTLGLFLLFVTFGDTLLGLMNENYKAAYWPLLIMAGGHLIRVLSGPGRALLQMKDLESEFLRLTFWTTVASLALMIPLTQQFGSIGAAMAASFEVAASGIIGSIICMKRLNLDPTVFGVIKASYRRSGTS